MEEVLSIMIGAKLTINLKEITKLPDHIISLVVEFVCSEYIEQLLNPIFIKNNDFQFMSTAIPDEFINYRILPGEWDQDYNTIISKYCGPWAHEECEIKPSLDMFDNNHHIVISCIMERRNYYLLAGKYIGATGGELHYYKDKKISYIIHITCPSCGKYSSYSCNMTHKHGKIILSPSIDHADILYYII